MNHIAKTLLKVIRIEVFLGIGVVFWMFSLEARSAPATELLEVEIAIMDCTILERAVDREYSASNANRPPNIPFNIQLCSELITVLKDEWLSLGLNPATKFFVMIGGSVHRASVLTMSELERQGNRATTERRKDLMSSSETSPAKRSRLWFVVRGFMCHLHTIRRDDKRCAVFALAVRETRTTFPLSYLSWLLCRR